jgi:putative hydrolase of the HAD superfamily
VTDALLLDFDGVLVDTEDTRLRAWTAALSEHRIAIDQNAYIRLTFLTENVSHRQLANALVPAHDQVDVERLVLLANAANAELAKAAPLMPGVAELLDDARRNGLRLAVVSDSPRRWVAAHLNRLRVLDLFDVLTCREDASARKPASQPYRDTVARLGAAPQHCIAIEDAPFGAQAADRAGIGCVAVPNALTDGLAFPHTTARIATLHGHTACTLRTLLDRAALAPAEGR